MKNEERRMKKLQIGDLIEIMVCQKGVKKELEVDKGS